ncbi:hypothetical protein FrEUN1fDRAFT_3031 [Parafrankia sp. EUN1f]|nr:hypothetical protein FrEUN1fDRAFT_3031 [Parafrankia sp. EUN1f]
MPGVHDDIRRGDELTQLGQVGQLTVEADDLDSRVVRAQGLLRAGHPGATDPFGAHEGLPVEVGFLQHARMNQEQPTDTGGGEVGRRRTTETTDSRHEHRRPAQSLLGLRPEARNAELAVEQAWQVVAGGPLLRRRVLRPRGGPADIGRTSRTSRTSRGHRRHRRHWGERLLRFARGNDHVVVHEGPLCSVA